LEIGDGAKRTADQSLDFGGATIDFPASFSRFALGCRAREHVVLGSDPTFAFTDHPVGNFLF
jgi:hypothetical protein